MPLRTPEAELKLCRDELNKYASPLPAELQTLSIDSAAMMVFLVSDWLLGRPRNVLQYYTAEFLDKLVSEVGGSCIRTQCNVPKRPA